MHRAGLARTAQTRPARPCAGYHGREHPLRAGRAASIWKRCKRRAGPDTAGLMLTNPNTVGLFDENILEITRIVHEAGGLCYYDGANLNAVMGVVAPGRHGL